MSLSKLGQFPALSCALELVRPGVSATLPFWRLSESEQFYLGGGGGCNFCSLGIVFTSTLLACG